MLVNSNKFCVGIPRRWEKMQRGIQAGAGLRRYLHAKAFFSPFLGGDGQVMKSVKQNNQSNLYFGKVISAAIGGKRGTLPHKSRGDILR